jgi:hypothetical protein
MFKRLFKRCWKCGGKGYRTVAGTHYTREELRTREDLQGIYVDILLNGGWAAPAVKETCPKCNGSGER